MRSIGITVVVAIGSATLLAQSAPIKMGLWEKTIVTSNGEGSPSTMKAKSCITPSAWQEMVANQSKPHEGCTMNTVKNANGYTFNGTCNIPHGSSLVISGSSAIPDSEHIVAARPDYTCHAVEDLLPIFAALAQPTTNTRETTP
jgi:hypothetical protein